MIDKEVNISFIGDISLNDAYTRESKNNKNPFKSIEPLLKNNDLLVGNLECVLESEQGENYKKKPRLKTNIETLSLIKSINPDILCLAHNHIYDNLERGFKNTQSFLRQSKIEFLGAGISENEASKTIIKTIKGIKFCFLNYVDKDTNPNLPDDCPLYLNFYDQQKVIKDIEKNRDADFVILLLHWGGRFEGGNFPDWKQRKHAKKLIDAGADLIVGHHSHTLQPNETIKGKQVFYSLGNFCFADIHSDNRIKPIDRKRYKQSAILTVSFLKDTYKSKLTYIQNKHLNIIVAPKIRFNYFIKQCVYFFMKHIKPIWSFYSFYFKIIDPIYYQLVRKDPEKSLLKRIVTFDLQKIKKLFR